MKLQKNHFTNQFPWPVFLQKGTRQWQQHYKDNFLVNLFLCNNYKIITTENVPRNYFVMFFGQDSKGHQLKGNIVSEFFTLFGVGLGGRKNPGIIVGENSCHFGAAYLQRPRKSRTRRKTKGQQLKGKIFSEYF